MNTNIFKKNIGIIVVALLIGMSIFPTINAATSNTTVQTITNDDVRINVVQIEDNTQISYQIQDYTMEEKYLNGQLYTGIFLGEESIPS